MTNLRWGWALPLVCAAGGHGDRDQVVARSLGTPDATVSRPFDRLRGVHELRDGRVVVVDANEQGVMVVDLARDRVVPLGRIGSGPREYRYPTGLLRLGGDSIGIIDNGNSRILVVTGAGRPGGTLGPHGLPLA
ncbi:MAG: hypothetical protein KF785_13345 [Gemmatimonadales bacterium]|nr:hypothetical protein [Gemmatimonadales bacterium]